jgi:DNA-binding IscR family transcriptional regulator
LIDVVSLFENVRPREACLLSDTRVCNEEQPCGAHHHWKRVQQNYHEFLETRTIADLTAKSCS